MQTQAECSTEIEIGGMGFAKKQQELVKNIYILLRFLHGATH